MTARRSIARLAALLVASLVASSCAGATDEVSSASERPGSGVTIVAARPAEPIGWFVAEVQRLLLERLGYDVVVEDHRGDVATYEAVARHELDLWTDGRFPSVDELLAGELDDGTTIGERAEAVGTLVPSGAISGLLVSKHLDEASDAPGDLEALVSSPELVAEFDIDDNGRADVLGCADDAMCESSVRAIIENEGWHELLEVTPGERGEHVGIAMEAATTGRPFLLFARAPDSVLASLMPGRDVLWLDLAAASDPTPIGLPDHTCSSPACRLGFPVDDIRVLANAEFLAEEPAARTILQLVQVSRLDVNLQALAVDQGADTPDDVARAAESWLEERRAQVLDWLDAARVAA